MAEHGSLNAPDVPGESNKSIRTRIVDLLKSEPLGFVELCLALWPDGPPGPGDYEAFGNEVRAMTAEGLLREEHTTDFFIPAVLIYLPKGEVAPPLALAMREEQTRRR